MHRVQNISYNRHNVVIMEGVRQLFGGAITGAGLPSTFIDISALRQVADEL